MKIGIITDTNILTKRNNGDESKLCNEEKFLENMDFFINYIEDIKNIYNGTELVYLMPETIIKELECQKIEAYNRQYKEFIKMYHNMQYGFIGEIPKNNIEAIVNKEKDIYSEQVKVVELKYQTKIYKELVNEALKKLPPFDKSKEKGKSDAGFKDALIWKTILYSEEIDDFDKIYFFSGDKIFENNSEYLVEQFNKIHTNTKMVIKFIEPNNEKMQNCLKIIIDENKLPETDCIKLYNKEFILEFIKKLKYNFSKIVKLKYVVWNDEEITLKYLLFKNFNTEDVNITKVKKETDRFIAEVRFKTRKYKIKPEEAKLFPRRYVKGILKLEFIKEENKFILQKYEIINVNFEKTLEEQTQEWANALNSINNNEIIKLVNDMEKMARPLKQSLGINLINNLSSLISSEYLIEQIRGEKIEDDEDDNNETKDQEKIK